MNAVLQNVPTCKTCTDRLESEVETLRAELHNAQTAADALAEALDDAQALCASLACHLQDVRPSFVADLLTPDELLLWDSVQPFGPD